jgi:hypothetical protein
MIRRLRPCCSREGPKSGPARHGQCRCGVMAMLFVQLARFKWEQPLERNSVSLGWFSPADRRQARPMLR